MIPYFLVKKTVFWIKSVKSTQEYLKFPLTPSSPPVDRVVIRRYHFGCKTDRRSGDEVLGLPARNPVLAGLALKVTPLHPLYFKGGWREENEGRAESFSK